ncbi:MAG TPA: response regulator [Gammaproteobacteria bacterium]|jgi:CheY-like chemotaxis protein|nr:response regulator [Gammaproteobacteria bacterium]
MKPTHTHDNPISSYSLINTKLAGPQWLGLLFYLQFQEAVRTASLQADSPATSSDKAQHKLFHANLLLVEDNDIARNISKIILKQFGCEVQTTASGKEAFNLVMKNDYALMIVDIGLPDIQGDELTRMIREQEKAQGKKHLPIIGLTALTFDKTKEECLKAGMNMVIRKPLTYDATKDFLNQFLPASMAVSEEKPTTPSGKDERILQLQKYPLFDLNDGLMHLGGNKRILLDALLMLVLESIPTERAVLLQAHAIHDWETINHTILKLSGGALHCGALRLTQACQLFEGRWIAQDQAGLESLYLPLMMILDETEREVKAFLECEKQV